jgi:hypothetical protein
VALTFAALKTRVALALQDAANTYWTTGTPTAELETYLNDGLRVFGQQSECLRQIATLVASNFDPSKPYAYWACPAGISPISWLDVWNAGLPLDATSSRDEGRNYTGWNEATGTPLRYITGLGGKNNLRVCPYPANDPAVWVNGATYVVGNTVLYSGSIYRCKVAGVSSIAPPSAASVWTLVGLGNVLTSLQAEVSYLAPDLVAGADVPGIPEEYHQYLEDYAVARALSRDGEKQDLDEASRRMALFMGAVQDAKQSALDSFNRAERFVTQDYF